MYQKNDLSHEDDGRKFKVSTDGGDKLPWEWQLDRDDALQIEAYYRAVDSLIVYLNKTKPEEWTGTGLYRATRQLIVRSGAQFDLYYPINRSERTFLVARPFHPRSAADDRGRRLRHGLAEALRRRRRHRKPRPLRGGYGDLPLAMSTALCRLPLKLLPVAWCAATWRRAA